MSAIDELKKMIDDDPDVGISLPARVDLELDARLKELEDKSKWIDQWNDAKPAPTDEELDARLTEHIALHSRQRMCDCEYLGICHDDPAKGDYCPLRKDKC